LPSLNVFLQKFDRVPTIMFDLSNPENLIEKITSTLHDHVDRERNKEDSVVVNCNRKNTVTQHDNNGELNIQKMWQMAKYKYPQIVDAAHHLCKTIALTRELLANEGKNTNIELEARFGRIVGDLNMKKFESGVDRSFLDKILQHVEQSQTWHHVSEWKEYHECFYRHNGINIRTTVDFDEVSRSTRTVHICKQVLEKNDYLFKSHDQSNNNSYDLRIALAKEQHLDDDQSLPPYSKPLGFRIKCRKSFIYKSESLDIPMWSFDFTYYWVGKTKEEAETKQHLKQERPIYEIECECINPKALFEANSNDFSIALSLLLKMRDFYGTDKQFLLQPL